MCGDRTILTVHSILSITRINKTKACDYLDEMLICYTFKMADQVVAVSKFMGEDLVKSYGVKESKLASIPNSVDVEVLRKKAEKKFPNEYLSLFDSPVVLNVGRLTHQKGHWFLIRAFKEVVRKVEDAKLVILGQGRLRNSIVRLIYDLGLEKKVHLLGFQDNPLKFMRRSEVFVLSSRWEGLPLVVLEALSAGTPVVAADCRSGPREILAPSTSYHYETSDMEAAEYGVLVPPVPLSESPSASDPPTRPETIMANAVTKVLTSGQMRKKYAQRGVERASNFSHRSVREHWLEIL
jgi:glycosyltransferase involved in cell wall biosynthesis